MKRREKKEEKKRKKRRKKKREKKEFCRSAFSLRLSRNTRKMILQMLIHVISFLHLKHPKEATQITETRYPLYSQATGQGNVIQGQRQKKKKG